MNEEINGHNDNREKGNWSFERLANFPSLIALLYIIGYIVFSSHLASYGVSDSNFLSLIYLKSGLVYLAINIPVGVFIYLELKHYKELREIHSKAQSVSFVLTVLYFALFANFILGSKVLPSSILMVGFVVAVLIMFFAKLKIPKLVRLIVPLMLGLGYCTLLIVKGKGNLMHIFMVLQLNGMILVSSIDDWKLDNKYSLFNLVMWIFSLIMLTSYFGYYSYKQIPYKYGGGMANEKTLILGPGQVIDNNILSKINLAGNTLSNVKVVHESERLYYISVNDNTTIGLKKEMFSGEISIIREKDKY